MSDYECVIYYGLRFNISVAEIDAIDEGTDQRVIAANSQDLEYYCSDLSSFDKQYFLFIGEDIAVLGRDDEVEAELTAEEYNAITESVRAKLKRAGFEEPPQLYMQWLHVFY